MKAPLVYLLDSNVLIQAKNQYYAFSICPGFWESLLGHHNAGAIYSIVQVRQELEIGGDELADWAAHTAPATFFLATHHVDVIARYQEIMTWL